MSDKPTSDPGAETSRRHVLKRAAVGGAVIGLLGHAWAWARSLVPNVLYEPPTRRKLGPPERFPDGKTFLAEEKIFIVRNEGRLRALSAVCTHLGCTVGEQAEGYHCPCHGSTFSADGATLGGPAPRALPWHPLEIGGGGSLIVDLGRDVGADVGLILGGGSEPVPGAAGEPK